MVVGFAKFSGCLCTIYCVNRMITYNTNYVVLFLPHTHPKIHRQSQSYQQGNDAVYVITSLIACMGHFTGHGIFLIFSTPQSPYLILRYDSKAEILYNLSLLNTPTISVLDKCCETQNITLLLKTSIFSCMGHFTGHSKIAITHATRRRNENQYHTFILLDMYKLSMMKF